MTRAAIYARYSSEGRQEASIEDQSRNREGFAQRQHKNGVSEQFQRVDT